MTIKNIIKTILTLVTFGASIAGIISVLKEKPILKITSISFENLTNLCYTDGLQATYNYKGKNVTSLSRLEYRIKNIGNQAIKSKGLNKNIMGEDIHFFLPKNYEIIDIKEVSKNSSIRYSFYKNKITILFTQWLPDEQIQLIIYVEPLKLKSNPKLEADLKEFDDIKIEHATLLLNTQKTLFQEIPQLLRILLLWFSILMYGVIFITTIYIGVKEITKYLNYQKWLKKNLLSYNKWIKLLRSQNILKKYREPKDLPSSLWYKSKTLTKPNIPNKNLSEIFWIGGVIIILTFFTLSLLFSNKMDLIMK